MGNKSLFNTLGLSKKEFSEHVKNQATDVSALHFSAMMKGATTEDLKIVCDELGIPAKGYEGRIVLLSRIYYFFNPKVTEQVATRSK